MARSNARVLLLLLVGAAARAEPGWQTVQTGPVTIKTRARPKSSIKEVWAEGDLDASPQDIQTVLMTPERFPQFMPYVKEARELGAKDSDGGQFVYTRLDLPLVASRDYILKVFLVKDASDGGIFANRWVAAPDRTPHRHGVVRLQVNEGSWEVTPAPSGKGSHVVYRFAVDPGGMIPSFAANLGNTQGVTDTFKAVEKEARRLAASRKSP